MYRYTLLLALLTACSSSPTSVIVELSASSELQFARPPIEIFAGAGHRDALPNTALHSGFLSAEPIRFTLTPDEDELEFTVLVEVAEIPPLEMRVHGHYIAGEARIVRVRLTGECTRGVCLYDDDDLTYCPADSPACPIAGFADDGDAGMNGPDAGADAP